jgi:GNAT superfamily N-acetyltransferase
MLGYLCAVGPFNNAFGSTEATGVFSPMGAHGAAFDNRADIYARMYQAAGEKWVRAGASSHAICLYAHDRETQDQFFRYGFGMRCIDAIREMDELTTPLPEGYSFGRVTLEDSLAVLPLDNLLDQGYIDSPFFMFRAGHSEEEWSAYWKESDPTCLVAYCDRKAVAFILAELSGETFIQETPGYRHITGLYCMPEHRGKGVSQKLLDLTIQNLKADGYARLGVDYESVNPSGSAFLQKYFTAYTHSVVRRIDEHALPQRNP